MNLLPERAQSLEDRRRRMEQTLREMYRDRRPQFHMPVVNSVFPTINWLALDMAQDKIKQHRPWYNPFDIDWNIHPPGPEWSLELPGTEQPKEGWYDDLIVGPVSPNGGNEFNLHHSKDFYKHTEEE